MSAAIITSDERPAARSLLRTAWDKAGPATTAVGTGMAVRWGLRTFLSIFGLSNVFLSAAVGGLAGTGLAIHKDYKKARADGKTQGLGSFLRDHRWKYAKKFAFNSTLAGLAVFGVEEGWFETAAEKLQNSESFQYVQDAVRSGVGSLTQTFMASARAAGEALFGAHTPLAASAHAAVMPRGFHPHDSSFESSSGVVRSLPEPQAPLTLEDDMPDSGVLPPGERAAMVLEGIDTSRWDADTRFHLRRALGEDSALAARGAKEIAHRILNGDLSGIKPEDKALLAWKMADVGASQNYTPAKIFKTDMQRIGFIPPDEKPEIPRAVAAEQKPAILSEETPPRAGAKDVPPGEGASLKDLNGMLEGVDTSNWSHRARDDLKFAQKGAEWARQNIAHYMANGQEGIERDYDRAYAISRDHGFREDLIKYGLVSESVLETDKVAFLVKQGLNPDNYDFVKGADGSVVARPVPADHTQALRSIGYNPDECTRVSRGSRGSAIYNCKTPALLRIAADSPALNY
ncbi:MAG: hypothetical protein H6853_08965 [Rhodospirillales bacterium]|nr:hypothetical protein [Alphaproteobacteria bacterium]USO03634.1 MAG: hypothetical protein H6853_08965 [Rhodospirillales bacterium]